ncbi:MAG: MopE-related protein, partial [Phycisphaerales bacterium]
MKSEKMNGVLPGARGVAIVVASIASVTGLAGSAWANDECVDAVDVQTAVPIAFSTTGATLSPNTPTDELCPNSSLVWGGSPDIWFRWIAPANGLANFTTCDPFGFDTSMVLYTGDCGNLVAVACNGDALDTTGCQELHSEIANFEVTGGTVYFIRIGGFDGLSGSSTLTVTHNRTGAWGSNANGQLRVPTNAGTLTKVSGGGEHALGLRADGTVVAWGANQLNQSSVPSTLGSVIDIDAGAAHSLALRSNGTVAAWGRNSSGQCNVPAALTDAVSIGAGANHSLAATAGGAVIAWGSNTFQQSTVPATLSGVVQVDAGELHSLARRSDGAVAAWGSNTNTQSTPPATLTDAVDIAAGGFHNLAVRSDGTVVAWGLNTFGQTAVPADLTDVVDIAAGRYHSLALRSDGTIVGWGYNANHQVTLPTNLGLSGSISAGHYFSLSVRDGCPTDPNKDEPGACGCGVVDTDTDGDGTADCNDLCPNDPFKVDPGQCGCGELETDTDSDGVADCVDLCPTDPDKTEPGQCGCGVPDTDTDGDGTADCNDLCPDLAALTAPVTYYADADLDGFGDAAVSVSECSTVPPQGYVADSSDCNDMTVLYADGDADGFGAGPMVACDGVPANGDCDDLQASVYPGAAEICVNDGVDNDCDGEADLDAEATDSIAYFVDGDLDGFGAGAGTISCTAIPGSVTNDLDCDDTEVFFEDLDLDGFGTTTMVPCGTVQNTDDCNDADPLVNPDAVEDCANLEVDNNCDGVVSAEEAIDSLRYRPDLDGDGFGAGGNAVSIWSCEPIPGYAPNGADCDDTLVLYADTDLDGFGAGPMIACDGVTDNTDCDDASNLVYPGALELCADLAVDNDCDGDVSDADASDSVAYFTDADGDGFGAGAAIMSCVPVEGLVLNSDDCDDAAVMYGDEDLDGFGAGVMIACGGVATDTDCNDLDALVFPGAPEVCADLAVDNDCDGDVSDLEASDSVAYFVDGDQDGFGAGAATMSCSAIAGSVTNSTDCDDASAVVFPGALENCENIAVDNDCDGDVSAVEAVDSITYYFDADQDGFGSTDSVKACSQPDGFVTNADDCDDLVVLWGDADQDGFGAGAMIACGGVENNTDCNDGDALVFPGAPEVCADLAIDNDCDGDVTDAEAADADSYCVDADQDGFGSGAITLSCSPIPGMVPNGLDCDDSTNLVFPGAPEVCADLAVDNDCDGDLSD